MIYALAVVVSWAFVSYPSFVIGNRRGIQNAWVAFIPFLGPTIVWLWSSDHTGWLCLLGLVPLVNIVFTVWLLFTMPAHHDRSRWWGFAFFVPFIGIYYYAFTLRPQRVSAVEGALTAD